MGFTPEKTDTDLARLLNLPVPPTNYPAVKFDRRIETRPDTFLPRTFWVGDSFSRQLLQVAATDTQSVLATLDYGFYFDEFRRWNEPGLFIEAGARVPVPALRSAELIVLEMNKAAITRFDSPTRRSAGCANAAGAESSSHPDRIERTGVPAGASP